MTTINIINPPVTGLALTDRVLNCSIARLMSLSFSGAKRVPVAYEPTEWVKDGSDFYCEHANYDTDTITQMAPNYITGDCDDYEVGVLVCTDCGEVAER